MSSEPEAHGRCWVCKERHKAEDLTPDAKGKNLCPTCYAAYQEVLDRIENDKLKAKYISRKKDI